MQENGNITCFLCNAAKCKPGVSTQSLYRSSAQHTFGILAEQKKIIHLEAHHLAELTLLDVNVVFLNWLRPLQSQDQALVTHQPRRFKGSCDNIHNLKTVLRQSCQTSHFTRGDPSKLLSMRVYLHGDPMRLHKNPRPARIVGVSPPRKHR